MKFITITSHGYIQPEVYLLSPDIIFGEGKIQFFEVADDFDMTQRYVDGGWIPAPTPIPGPLPPADPSVLPEASNTWWLTKLGFRNRFTNSEKAAIEYAASQTTLQAAGLRAHLADQRDAKYIDLKRTDTRQGVIDLETAGLLASGRSTVILDTPLVDEERFIG